MIILVNVFTVLPEKQEEALQKIQQVYLEVVKHQPGFISAKLLKSDDGTKVTAIAHWESAEQLAAMRETQGFKDLHNQEFYDAIVANDAHVYSNSNSIEVSNN
ncbi:antibiotic biosynthesis monooxygenase family protein [Nostoc sp. 106C]|jgi:heme-degrading monooxygenase HmoA|uniref:antibiotic biosynthesis monooxygenase family protein n=1 Tax=Nostoc sp. 106C TaxID=1932667 RepID=UPI000A3D5986|nr:antibiotic biosynthesis monooxygenase family protein [Nostoc sp. 106C]OUL21750.1 antibiotic biosynthesis monooxygenase [Nostoc sp. RF31YmG]OUL25333.1 antibiotic biosynthesis monooxygenase [Nostoc sp. 106C]